jgi:hypothetical protein
MAAQKGCWPAHQTSKLFNQSIGVGGRESEGLSQTLIIATEYLPAF